VSIHKYAVFAKVSETLNLSQAAKELNYTQSSVSQIISGLEKELGMPLIIRTKGGVMITECGQRLLKPIKELLHWNTIIDNTVQSMQAVDEGHIKVGVFSSVLLQWIPPILKEITSAHPRIEVELIQGDYSTLEKMLEDNQLDCTFMIEVPEQSAVFLPLYNDEFFVILHKDHPLCEYERIPVEALSKCPLILIDEGDDKFDTYQIVKDVKQLNIQYRIKEDFGAIPMVENGLGICILPALSLRNIHNDCDVVAKQFAVPRSRTLGISVRSLQWATPLTQLFIDTTMKFVEHYSTSPQLNKPFWFNNQL